MAGRGSWLVGRAARQDVGHLGQPGGEEHVDEVMNAAVRLGPVLTDRPANGPKYALGGWPHAVVIDRQGRIRHFKSGALLK